MKDLGTGATGVMRAPTIDEERERLMPSIKEFRKEIDALIQRVAIKRYPVTENSLAIGAYAPEANEAYDQVRKSLMEAKMWAGKMLEGLGNPLPAELADKAN